MVEQGTENPRVVGSIPTGGTIADLAHLVERDLAKVEVAGSSPVIRSTKRARSEKTIVSAIFIRRHSQAVRQRSAKPLFPGPIPGGASKKFRTRECAEFFTFSLFTLHFSLIRRVRIFWKVIGNSE